MKIQTTVIYEHLQSNVDKNIILLQGSSRSSKTYNTLIWFVLKLLSEPNKTLSIVRKTGPSLKASAIKDLIEILKKLEIYEPDKYHKVDGYYELPNGSIIDFISVDDENKIRGRKRDYLYINEGLEISRDEYVQLLIRTTSRPVVIDFNPSALKSWIYDLEEDPKNILIKTTYKDNPFLTDDIIEGIESLQYKDKNLWRVFGLGERGISTTNVFNTWEVVDDFPTEGKKARGLDFGFNDPTTLIEVRKIDDSLYVKELLYSRGLTISDLIFKIRELNIELTDEIWCDSASPQNIEDLRRNKINAKPVKKDSILHGIQLVKSHRVFIHKDSKNLLDELQEYRFKTDKDGNILDVPEDKNNHCIDALRYALEMITQQKSRKITII
jgi:phage terminase large subunit